MLEVGRVVRPHGLRGHTVVELWTNRDERMRPGSELSSASRTLIVSSASRLADTAGRARWLVAFAGVDSREEADALRDAVLSAAPMEVDGAFWVHEMVGQVLYGAGGEPVGRVEAVEANPASDLLLLDDGRVVPLTFVSRDEQGRLTVDGPPGLLDP